ncbi:hypothetical protein OGM63_18805 [Plectonema radiosum NIES-515]|uniref:Uncharacterized protein n=1 Tax=Plectonema radiosum NIES-515 TaxID=2986073 RepID=A0ABT3B2G5_9CYAN|nr:hypothetical protein [Plectonema radiosum]MCV3215537.1 hypothetical protein [Plectonema radiosum NIES-515]
MATQQQYHLMKGIALENECISIPDAEAGKFIRDISCAAVEMLKAENQSFYQIKYPENLRSHIVELAQLCPPTNREQNQNYTIPELGIKNLLEKIGNFYHDVVGTLGGQLQIEVDRGKSANRSNPEIVNACNTIIKSFDVAPWVEERKLGDVYTKREINIKGHGAIDMMARMTNNAFAESAITARSTQQFQDLFKGVEFSPTQKASAVQIKKIYDSLIHRAVTISREVEQSPGLKIIATSPQGQQIEIIGLAEKKHPNLFDDRKLDITVVKNKSPYKQSQNKWITILPKGVAIAIGPVFDADGKPKLQSNGQQQTKHLGYISEACLQQFQGSLKQFSQFRNLTKEAIPGFAPSQVKAAFTQVREYAIAIRESIPDLEKEAVAAAMWQVSTASKEDAERGFKKTSAVFAIFGEELVGRLGKLQFTEFAVVGTHKTSNEHLGRKWVGEKVECHIEQLPDPANPTHNKRWLVAENNKLGVFRSESAQLPIGTSFTAKITSPPSASVIITSTQGNKLKVGQMKKYAFAEREWNGEDGVITIKIAGSSKAFIPIAFVDDKPLGVVDKESFKLLSERLNVRSIKIDGFKFQGVLESAPATIANIKVDPETIRYPQVWTREEALVREKKIKANEKVSVRTEIPTTDTTKTEPVKREEWEKKMLKLAFACLKKNPANAGEEMQTATFGDGKYRVIYHTPSEMLRIVDEKSDRGTLYKVQRGKAIQVCGFTEDEKPNFEQSKVELYKHLGKSAPKGLLLE